MFMTSSATILNLARSNWQLFIVVVLLAITKPAFAIDPAAQRGFTFARYNCSKCHAIGLYDTSQLSDAPRFRDLHLRYPVEDLAESLSEGILTGHPSMPQWRLDPDRISDLLAYLKTLER